MTPFEQRIFDVIYEFYSENGRQPVRTCLLQEELNIPRRTLLWYLDRLEDKGMLERPDGPKRGWSPVPTPRRVLKRSSGKAASVRDKILDWIKKLTASGWPVPTWIIAQRVKKDEQTVRDYLLELEKAGQVCRPRGPKRGWMLAQNAA